MKASGFIAGLQYQGGHSSREPDPGFSEPFRDLDAARQSLPGASRKLKAVRKTAGAGVICLGLITGIGFQLWRERSPLTDQARVERDSYPISSRIEGPIRKIFVSNRQYVKTGDLLVEIDKRELEAHLATAGAEVAQAQMSMQAIGVRLAKAQPELEKAASILRHRERELDPVMLDYEILLSIQQKKGVSPARLWTTRKAYEAQLRLYLEAKAALGSAIDRVQDDQGLREVTAANLQSAEAMIQHTQLQLSYARIYAPVNGRVAFDKSKLAQRLRAGEIFLSLVGEPWVVANFKKSELKHLKPGQRVRIRIGAIKQRTFQGKVASASTGQIVFDAESLRDFEDRMDPGLLSSVVVAPE